MRSLILTLSLALALPMIPSVASATAHSCNQLRQTIYNQAPITTRNLPYGYLTCAAVSEIHLLIVRRSSYSSSQLESRIEAVFRGEGLIR